MWNRPWTRVRGSLAVVAEDFRAELSTRGYSTASIEAVVAVLRDLSAWLSAENLEPSSFGPEEIERFLVARRARDTRRHRFETLASITPILEFLRNRSLVPPLEERTSPSELLLANYRFFLAHERGLAARTVSRYEQTARRLLTERARSEGSGNGAEGLSAKEVRDFLLADCRGLRPSSAKTRVGELRTLCNYLFLAGEIDTPLSGAVPKVASWHGTTLPRRLPPGQVAALLASCDRAHPTGRRDLAILLVLARLGLRAAEVAGLRLDDLDWRAGTIAVRGKGGRIEKLPLPVDVGEAMAAYLEDGRPSLECRNVFIRRKAPLGALSSSGITTVVRLACERAGVEVHSAHRLRHGLATELVTAGAGLNEIAQLLRHRDLQATAMYAKVDRASLLALARPWPEGLA